MRNSGHILGVILKALNPQKNSGISFNYLTYPKLEQKSKGG